MIIFKLLVFFHLFIIVSCSSISLNKHIKQDGILEDAELQNQNQFLISSLAVASRKLHDIAWPIMASNIDICPDSKINAFGIMVSHIDDLPLSLKPSFYAASPITIADNNAYQFPMIISVAENSPADKA